MISCYFLQQIATKYLASWACSFWFSSFRWSQQYCSWLELWRYSRKLTHTLSLKNIYWIFQGKRCMMLPWIVVGWVRAIFGTFQFFMVLEFPVGSCLQVSYFIGHSFYFSKFRLPRWKVKTQLFFLVNTLYSLNVVTKSYRLMLTTTTENHELDNAENLTYIKFLLNCFFEADFIIQFLFIILCIVNCIVLIP